MIFSLQNECFVCVRYSNDVQFEVEWTYGSWWKHGRFYRFVKQTIMTITKKNRREARLFFPYKSDASAFQFINLQHLVVRTLPLCFSRSPSQSLFGKTHTHLLWHRESGESVIHRSLTFVTWPPNEQINSFVVSFSIRYLLFLWVFPASNLAVRGEVMAAQKPN